MWHHRWELFSDEWPLMSSSRFPLPVIAITVALAASLLTAPASTAAEPGWGPLLNPVGKSEEEKAAEKAAKEAQKAADKAAKEAQKASKEAEKAAEKAVEEADKAAKEAQKAADKAAKEASKDAKKQVSESAVAAARAEAAANAVLLIAEYSDSEIKNEIKDAQRDAGATFRELRKNAQEEFAEEKKQARADYKAALALANQASTKAERKELRKAAKATYDAAKRRNRTSYLSALENARRYNGKAQIVFFDPGVDELGEYDDAIAVAAVATSGLPVEISSQNAETCGVADGLVTPKAPGECRLLASQSGNDTFAPAIAEATIQIIDQPDPQTIEFSALPTLRVGADGQPLAASATSELPVVFASLTPAICGVSGTTVVALAAGSCIVEARQPGDEVWQAAEPVEQAVTVEASEIVNETGQ